MAVNDYTDLFEAAGKQYNVDPALLAAQAVQESGGNPNAIGPVTKWGRAKGLMQLIPETALKLGVKDPTDPKQAIPAAAQLMAQNLDKFGNVQDAVSAYHGSPNQKLWGPKTRAYRDAVMARYQGGSSGVDGQDTVQGSTGEDDLLALARGDTPKAAPAPSATQAPGDSPDDLLSLARGDVGASGTEAASKSANLQVEGTKIPITDAQQKTVDLMVKQGKWSNAAEAGTEQHPFHLYAGHTEADVPPGAYYVDYNGEAKRAPGGDRSVENIRAQYGKALLALKAGDVPGTLSGVEQASGIAAAHEAPMEAAFQNRLLSGAMLGGKNEAIAALQTVPDVLSGHGGAGLANLVGGNAQYISPAFHEHLTALDRADALQHANHPMASDLGALTGAGLSTALLPEAKGATLLARAAKAAPGAAGVGATQGFLGTDGSMKERLDAAKQGGVTGLIAGPAGEVASTAGASVINRLTGGGVSTNTADLARKARDMGINLRGGQISASPAVNFMDSVLNRTPLTGYAAKSADQRTAFTRAVANTFGSDSDKLTPDVMQAAKTRIGNEMDRVASVTTIKADNQLINDLANVEHEARQVATSSQVEPTANQISNILDKVSQNGEITGDAYKTLTSHNGPLDRALHSSDGEIRHYASQVRNALDDALERSANPDDVAALRKARWQYKNLMTVKGLAAKAGVEGEISPALLMGAVNKSFSNRAFQGAGDLGDLSDIGQRFLKEPPSSGTTERLGAKVFLGGLGIGGGGLGVQWALQNPEEALKIGASTGVAALGGAVAGRGVASVLDNPFYRNMLLSGAGKPLRALPTINGPTAALLTNRLLNSPQFRLPSPEPAKVQ